MKRHLAPSLFALSLCALLGGTRAAEAQGAGAIVPATVDSVDVSAPTGSEPAGNVGAARFAPIDFRPVAAPMSPVGSHQSRMTTDVFPSPDYAAVLGRNWKMPTSRTLMIGGTVAAIVGLAAIGGDTGAIVAMAGGGVAVYGLYLHYNR